KDEVMDPGSLAIMSLAGSAGGGILNAFGSAQSARANSTTAMYQAAVAHNNSIIAENNAQYALAVGRSQAETQNYKTRELLGVQKARQGASGIDVNSGSALDVRRSTIDLGQLDALTILNNAGMKAAGYRAQAQ